MVVSDGGRAWESTRSTPCRTCSTTSYRAPSRPRFAWRSRRRVRLATISTGLYVGLDSVGQACRMIADGPRRDDRGRHRRADLPDHHGVLRRDQATTPRKTTIPATASRPFDRNQERVRARRRDGDVRTGGHRPRAPARRPPVCRDRRLRLAQQRLPQTGLRPDGKEMPRPFGSPWPRAETRPEDIDYINATLGHHPERPPTRRPPSSAVSANTRTRHRSAPSSR